jgi:hypothetical protein
MRGSVFNIQTMAIPAPRQDSSTDYIFPADALVMFTTQLWNALRQQKNKTKKEQQNKTTYQNNKDNNCVLK